MSVGVPRDSGSKGPRARPGRKFWLQRSRVGGGGIGDGSEIKSMYALPEDLSLSSSTHVRWLTAIWDCSSRGSDTSSLSRYLFSFVHTPPRHIHIDNKKTNL